LLWDREGGGRGSKEKITNTQKSFSIFFTPDCFLVTRDATDVGFCRDLITLAFQADNSFFPEPRMTCTPNPEG